MSRKLAVYHKSDHEELQKTKRQKRSNTQASSRRLHIAVLLKQACRRTSHNACGDTVHFCRFIRMNTAFCLTNLYREESK